MARVKRAVNAHKKRRDVLERASGYRGQRSRLYRKAKEQVTHSVSTPTTTARSARATSASSGSSGSTPRARANGMTYNRFIQGLKAADVEVDRRMLAELAVNDPAAFAALVEVAAKAAAGRRQRAGRLRLSRPVPRPSRSRTPRCPDGHRADLHPRPAGDGGACGCPSGRSASRDVAFLAEGPQAVPRGRRRPRARCSSCS